MVQSTQDSPSERRRLGSQVIADGAATSIEFSAATNGLLLITNSASDRNGIISFRVGTAGYCNKYGGSSLLTALATGPVTGTTGTETHLKVGISTANIKLYIENWTESVSTVSITLVSVSAAAYILEAVS